MAKWGEGDPRWLVEHREDGKNVNGWHWSEKNRMEWSRRRLGELLPGVEAEAEGAAAGGQQAWAARVTEVKSVTGEAMLTTRKGNKRFAFYDLKITLAWEAAPLAAAGAEPGAAAEAAEGPAEPAGEPAGEAVAGAAADVAAGGGEVPRVSGEISVAEFGSGSDHEDIELSVTASGGSVEEQARMKRHAEKALWPLILQRLEQYVRELGEEEQ